MCVTEIGRTLLFMPMHRYPWLTMAVFVAVSYSSPLLAQEGGLKKILDDLPTYQRYVEEIRGEKFDSAVPGSRQSKGDFRKFVEKSMDEEIPPERVEGWSKSLKKLGLLPPSFELRGGLVDFFVTQAGAYYDPKSEAFYVIQADFPQEQIRTIVVHELQHALQDQIFDLDLLTEKVKEAKNSDVESALSFLVEGEATYVMTLDQMKQGMGVDTGKFVHRTVEMSLKMVRKMDLATMTELSRSMGGGNEAMDEAAEALETMPNFISRSFVDPYNWGAYAVAKVYGKEGWEGVSKLFREPPTSTEQLMHPAKLLHGDDPPVAVKAPEISLFLGPGWKRTYDDTMGEHGILIMLDEYLGKPKKRDGHGGQGLEGLLRGLGAGDSPGEKPAAGWGGDRYALYERERGGSLLAWVTTWDSERDAHEFFEAYRGAVRARFRSTTLGPPDESVFREAIGSDLETEYVLGAVARKDVIVLIAPADVRATKILDHLVEHH